VLNFVRHMNILREKKKKKEDATSNHHKETEREFSTGRAACYFWGV